MSKTVLVPIADGTEEMEAVTIIDVLRRAGAQVTVASAGKLQVTASRGTKLTADTLLSECSGMEYDLIALPGGMPGAENLRDSTELLELLKAQNNKGSLIAAICAAPAVVLKKHGLINQIRATCHPNFKQDLDLYKDASIVTDKNIITGQGPGISLDFALELVKTLYGTEKAHEVEKPMCRIQPNNGDV